jgi:hypothetical protein
MLKFSSPLAVLNLKLCFHPLIQLTTQIFENETHISVVVADFFNMNLV